MTMETKSGNVPLPAAAICGHGIAVGNTTGTAVLTAAWWLGAHLDGGHGEREPRPQISAVAAIVSPAIVL